MTHRDQSNTFDEVVQFLAEQGFGGMAQAMQTLFNEMMKLERTAVLGVAPYERSAARRGQANGFKPKTVTTRLGKLELQVPQTRGIAFYPSALEKGERSERALKLALAEMYVQGVSTRKVAEITANSVAARSPARRSAGPPPHSMPNWKSGATGRWEKHPI